MNDGWHTLKETAPAHGWYAVWDKFYKRMEIVYVNEGGGWGCHVAPDLWKRIEPPKESV